ncbi:hypothetical protein K0M31_020029, partial [Melipona bicolor]
MQQYLPECHLCKREALSSRALRAGSFGLASSTIKLPNGRTCPPNFTRDEGNYLRWKLFAVRRAGARTSGLIMFNAESLSKSRYRYSRYSRGRPCDEIGKRWEKMKRGERRTLNTSQGALDVRE